MWECRVSVGNRAPTHCRGHSRPPSLFPPAADRFARTSRPAMASLASPAARGLEPGAPAPPSPLAPLSPAAAPRRSTGDGLTEPYFYSFG